MYRLLIFNLIIIQIYSFDISRKNIFRSFIKNNFDPNDYIQNEYNEKMISNFDYISEPTDYELSQFKILDSIIPLTPNQETYDNFLNDDSFPIIIVNGPTGTGKTLLAMNKAFNDLKNEFIEKIIIINPLILSKQNITNNIYDTLFEYCSEYEIEYLIQNKKITFESMENIRGMTFKDSFVICEDMQYSTPFEMLMLITRIGINSRIIISGDTNQTSIPLINGLSDIINKLHTIKDLDFIKYIQMTMDDIQRHPIIKNILKAYN